MDDTYSGRQPQGITPQTTEILEPGEITPPSAFKAYIDTTRTEHGYNNGLRKRYLTTSRTGNRPNYWNHTKSQPQVSQENETSKTPYRRIINGVIYEIRKGSITEYAGTSIVNAANEQNLGGGGVDGAISKAGGTSLHNARANMSNIWGDVKIRTGDARLTSAGDLPCKYVIHAVGPNLNNFPYDINLLKSSYLSCISEAYRYNIKDIAFPIISGGVFRGDYSLQTMINTAFDALIGNENDIKEIVFYGFTEEEVKKLIMRLSKEK